MFQPEGRALRGEPREFRIEPLSQGDGRLASNRLSTSRSDLGDISLNHPAVQGSPLSPNATAGS